jgi:hypothetical protein
MHIRVELHYSMLNEMKVASYYVIIRNSEVITEEMLLTGMYYRMAILEI